MAMSSLHPAFIEKFMLMAMSNIMRKKEAQLETEENPVISTSESPEIATTFSINSGPTGEVLDILTTEANTLNFTASSLSDLTTLARIGLDWKARLVLIIVFSIIGAVLVLAAAAYALTKCRKQNEWDLPQSTDFYRPRYAAKPAFQDVPTSFATLSNIEQDSSGADNEVRL